MTFPIRPTGSIVVSDTEDLRSALRAGYHASQIDVAIVGDQAAIDARHAGYAAGLLAGKAQASSGGSVQISANAHQDNRTLPTAHALPGHTGDAWAQTVAKHVEAHARTAGSTKSTLDRQ
jgi:hypothetical protein